MIQERAIENTKELRRICCVEEKQGKARSNGKQNNAHSTTK